MVKALRWDKVNKIRKVCDVQYRTVFSILAETERYDIVRSSLLWPWKQDSSSTGQDLV